MIEKEGGKHNIQTNEKKLSELHGNWWIAGKEIKGWLQIAKTSNAMQFRDACPEIDEGLIKKPRIGGCHDGAEAVFLGLEAAIEPWEIVSLGV